MVAGHGRGWGVQMGPRPVQTAAVGPTRTNRASSEAWWTIETTTSPHASVLSPGTTGFTEIEPQCQEKGEGNPRLIGSVTVALGGTVAQNLN